MWKNIIPIHTHNSALLESADFAQHTALLTAPPAHTHTQNSCRHTALCLGSETRWLVSGLASRGLGSIPGDSMSDKQAPWQGVIYECFCSPLSVSRQRLLDDTHYSTKHAHSVNPAAQDTRILWIQLHKTCASRETSSTKHAHHVNPAAQNTRIMWIKQ